MKAINKITLLNALEREILSQLDEVNNYGKEDSETLLKPAADGGWSIAQCLEHLNTYSAWYNAKISEALADKKQIFDGDIFTSGWLGNYLTNMMKKDTAKKKYKAMPAHKPAEDLNAKAVLEAFIAHQQVLLQYIRQCKNFDLGVRIPTTLSKLIKLKLGDVLQFMAAHQQRHLAQAKRNYSSQQLASGLVVSIS